MNNDQLRTRVKHFFIVSTLLMLGVMMYLHHYGNKGSVFFSDSQSHKVEYWNNGNIKHSGYMDGYLKDGTWLFYTEEGELRLKEEYDQGKLISSEEVLAE